MHKPQLLLTLPLLMAMHVSARADSAPKSIQRIPLSPQSISDGFTGVKSGPFDPRFHIFPVIEKTPVGGTPAELQYPTILHAFLDRNQYFFQSFKCGDMPESAYRQMEDIDESTLSPDWHDSVLTVAVGANQDGNPVLLVDTDNDEDLSDEKPISMQRVEIKDPDKTVSPFRAESSSTIEYFADGETRRLQVPLTFTLPDPTNPQSLYWSSNTYHCGTWTIGKNKLQVALPARPTYRLGQYAYFYIDSNGNGSFDTSRTGPESYSLAEPFELAGKSWKVTAIAIDGSWIEFAPAQKPVAARAILAKGAPAPGFDAKAQDGQQLSLDQLRGSHVLLVFWATWCPHCLRENKNLIRARETFDEKRLKMIGFVANEDVAAAKKSPQVRKLNWPQIFGAEQASVARTYRVSSFPVIILVGSDGKIAATGNELRGDRLLPTLRKFIKTE